MAIELDEHVSVMRAWSPCVNDCVEIYVPFDVVTRNALAQASLESGFDLNDATVDDIMDEYINKLPSYVRQVYSYSSTGALI